MVASRKTIDDIYRVIERHIIDPEMIAPMLDDLSMVEGNRSFRDTVDALKQVHMRKHVRET
jgi:hypothetical protein